MARRQPSLASLAPPETNMNLGWGASAAGIMHLFPLDAFLGPRDPFGAQKRTPAPRRRASRSEFSNPGNFQIPKRCSPRDGDNFYGFSASQRLEFSLQPEMESCRRAVKRRDAKHTPATPSSAPHFRLASSTHGVSQARPQAAQCLQPRPRAPPRHRPTLLWPGPG